MDSNEETTEKLIRYLDDELVGEDLTAVEVLLKQNEALQAELAGLQLAQQAVRRYGLANQVAAARKEMLASPAHSSEQQPARIYPLVRSVMRYAALLVVALGAAGIYMYASTSSANLYRDHYQQYRLSTARGQGTGEPIADAFKQANYTAVIADFKKMPAPANRDYFLAAQAYQASHDYARAISLYKHLAELNTTDNSYRDDAGYYLGLTYLENNQPAEAKAVFEKIYADPDDLYHSKVSFWMMLRLKILALKQAGK